MQSIKYYKQAKGFTLIELLVVIAIIGLLSTLAIVSLNSARQSSRDAKRVADFKQIQTALELRFNANSQYPAAVAFDGTGQITATDGTVFMGLVPSDPVADSTDATEDCTWAAATAGANTSCTPQYVLGNSSLPTPGTDAYEIIAYLEGEVGDLTRYLCVTEAGIVDGVTAFGDCIH
ncbi:hypothetical protein CL634_07115 [bacterium]|nr:hypothetical protein [bacterium]|tara:strand:+ start:13 stop:543 length:531 start_codon:yes stop_codon:yes gene_type:complete